MARKETETDITHHVTSAADVPNLSDMNAVSVERHVNAIALNKEFGLTVYDRRSSMAQIQFHLRQSAESMLEAGRLLIQMRENEEHGNWLSLLNELNIDVTLDKRLRQAALKFSNGATSHHLITAAGNKSKLFELMILDDEDIAELNDGGTVAGLQLDDVARMSTSELRKALRAQREKTAEIAKAKDDVISGKSKFIDQLEEKLATALNKKTNEKPEANPEMPGEYELMRVQEAARELVVNISAAFNSDIMRLINVFDGQPPRNIQLAIAQSIGLLITSVHQVADNVRIDPITEAATAAHFDPTWAAITAEQDAD